MMMIFGVGFAGRGAGRAGTADWEPHGEHAEQPGPDRGRRAGHCEEQGGAAGDAVRVSRSGAVRAGAAWVRGTVCVCVCVGLGCGRWVAGLWHGYGMIPVGFMMETGSGWILYALLGSSPWDLG